MLMRPAVAIEELTKLKAEAESAGGFTRQSGEFESWRARVRSVLVRSLGADNDTVKSHDNISYFARLMYPKTFQLDAAHRQGVERALALIDAAVYELRLIGGDEPVDESVYDPELWAHVAVQIADKDWGKVASQAAIFVEDRVRAWAGTPQDSKGGNLVGKQLYAEVFGDASAYRLGRQGGEFEGWRFLGMGFTQALRNVDLHRIQKRDDAKRYALGVLGLGSLLLTQLRFEHSDILKTE